MAFILIRSTFNVMPKKIPNEVRSDIIRRHLQGESRDSIAGALGISGSTASGAWGEFLSAARSYGVESEVTELRDLAVKLRKEAITVAQAKDGATLRGLIRGLKVDEMKLAGFVSDLYRACGELHYDPKWIVQHMATVDGLEAKGRELKASNSDREAKIEAAGRELRQLDALLNAKRTLTEKIAEVEAIGLNVEYLETIRRTVAAIGAKYGLNANGSMRKLLSDLKDQYDPVLRFENQLRMLQSQAGKFKHVADTVKSISQNLAAQDTGRGHWPSMPCRPLQGRASATIR